MQKIAPVNMPYNVKTLWFDPADIDVHVDDRVVVRTARGLEMGKVCGDVFEVTDEEIEKLKSPLRPIERIATEEDMRQAAQMEEKSRAAMPIFKKLARETNEDMHPVTVEYMLDGDKAIFYFEAEERIDFRDLVRKLANEFHVRIDMRQIGVRDEARIVGGLAHCGQVVCCKRLGGEFNPVSIRMAKDQDLSLNPQKISGLCGRLMCCLRYENSEYKEFKAKAPKMDACIKTPDGEGKVVEFDVPRETIAIKIEDEKPVKVPLSAFDVDPENRKKASVDPEAWERAVEKAHMSIYDAVDLLHIPSFTGEDKLGAAKAVHNPQSEKKKHSTSEGESSNRRHSRGRSHSGKAEDTKVEPKKRTPRRRSTKIKADGSEKETSVVEKPKKSPKNSRPKSANGKQAEAKQKKTSEGKLRPGHKSSGLAHNDAGKQQASDGAAKRRRRRRRKPAGDDSSPKEN